MTRPDLARRGIDLARMMRLLLPDSAEAAGLLALLLLTESRQAARVDGAGQLVLMEDQDRSLWDRELIGEGLGLVEEALAQSAGRFGLMAALHGDTIVEVSLTEATARLKTVPEDWYAVAKAFFG